MLHLARVAVYTLTIYGFLIVGLRALGRRQLGQLTVVDLAVILILGSAVETAMIAGDVSLQAGLVSAAILLAADRTIGQAVLRSRRMRRILLGGPVLLVHNGQILADHLRGAGLTESDLMEALREREVDAVDQVRFAVLEMDGSINVIRRKADTETERRGDAGTG